MKETLKKTTKFFLSLVILTIGVGIFAFTQTTRVMAATNSISAVSVVADRISSNPVEHITVKTANIFPISSNGTQIYFEVEGLPLGKTYYCEVSVNGSSDMQRLENLGNGKASLSYYVNNPTTGTLTYTLKIFEQNDTLIDYQSATGFKYLPVDLSVNLAEDTGLSFEDLSTPQYINTSNFQPNFNLQIPGEISISDPDNATVEMLNSVGTTVAVKTASGYLDTYSGTQRDPRYDVIFTGNLNIYLNTTNVYGSLFAGQALQEGNYNIRIKSAGNTYLYNNVINVTNKPVVSNIMQNIQEYKPATVGNDSFYLGVQICGGALSDFSLSVKDKNGVEVATSSKDYRVTNAYSDSKTAVYKMALVLGKSLAVNELYTVDVISSKGEASFIKGYTYNSLYVNSQLQIYSHTFLEELNAKFSLKTVNALNNTEYKFELEDRSGTKLAEQIATTTNNLFTLDFTGITLAKNTSYIIKGYSKDQVTDTWNQHYDSYYSINTYNFGGHYSYNKQAYWLNGQSFILPTDTTLPFEINMEEKTYPVSGSYTVTLVNTADGNDKIIAQNVIKSSISITFNQGGTPEAYLNLKGNFTLPTFVEGKKYKLVVTSGTVPVEVTTLVCIKSTEVIARYGYVSFQDGGLDGYFSLIKNGVTIDPTKFTIVLSNVLGVTYEVPNSAITFTSNNDNGAYERYYDFKVNTLPIIPQGWYFEGCKYDGKDVKSIDTNTNVFTDSYPSLYSILPNSTGLYSNQQGTCFGVGSVNTDVTKIFQLWLYDAADQENCIPVKKITLIKDSDYSNVYSITTANSVGVDFTKVYDAVFMYDGEAIGTYSDVKFSPKDKVDPNKDFNGNGSVDI